MSRCPPRLPDYLSHILEAIERIELYTASMQEAEFLESSLVQDAVVRNLEVIGEASNNVEKHQPEFVTGHPGLPFSSAYEMRDALAHGYFKIDFEIVWRTIQQNLPALHAQITVARNAMSV